jgi:hypothetical protein
MSAVTDSLSRLAETYRRRVVVPASLVIGLVGLYWAIERLGLLTR